MCCKPALCCLSTIALHVCRGGAQQVRYTVSNKAPIEKLRGLVEQQPGPYKLKVESKCHWVTAPLEYVFTVSRFTAILCLACQVICPCLVMLADCGVHMASAMQSQSLTLVLCSCASCTVQPRLQHLLRAYRWRTTRRTRWRPAGGPTGSSRAATCRVSSLESSCQSWKSGQKTAAAR